MTNRTPDEEELRSRIIEHLEARPGNDRVVLIWQGYLAGLLEWAGLGFHAYERLTALLPNLGSTEIVEMMIEPDWEEMMGLSDEEATRRANEKYEQQMKK